jgi:DUF1365 family protein
MSATRTRGTRESRRSPVASLKQRSVKVSRKAWCLRIVVETSDEHAFLVTACMNNKVAQITTDDLVMPLIALICEC